MDGVGGESDHEDVALNAFEETLGHESGEKSWEAYIDDRNTYIDKNGLGTAITPLIFRIAPESIATPENIQMLTVREIDTDDAEVDPEADAEGEPEVAAVEAEPPKARDSLRWEKRKMSSVALPHRRPCTARDSIRSCAPL